MSSDGHDDRYRPRGANPMRALTLSIAAAVLLTVATPVKAQVPAPVYDPEF